MNSKKAVLYFFLSLCIVIQNKAQQNNTLYLAHDIAQSNLLNAAIPLSCKWYLGIPVLSSIHANYANSSFTYNQLFAKDALGTYNPDLESITKRLHFRNYMGTEFQTQLFALGYKNQDFSFIFSVTEKNNIPLTYPKDLIQVLLEGNAPFIGDEVSLKGTGLYFNHYREYAFGVSKKMEEGFYVGARAKVLFGKLNATTRSTNIRLLTDETTFNLDLKGDVLIHSSLPIIVDTSNSQLNLISYNDNISPLALALNRKNPGLAFDGGVVYAYSEDLELSASVIDLGFIRWGSNLNTFDLDGAYTFKGVFTDTTGGGTFQNFGSSFLDSMQLDVYAQKYLTFLPARIMAGANYRLNSWLQTGLVGNIIIYKSKAMPSITLMGQMSPVHWLGIMASYTVQNYSYNNLGFGIYLGKKPVQFYIVSDNVWAIYKPLDARMANVRFGLNIYWGCSEKAGKSAASNTSPLGCFGMNVPNSKSYLKKLKPWSERKRRND